MRDSSIAALDLANLECRRQLLRVWHRAYEVEADLVGIEDFPPLRVSLEALAARPGTFYGLSRAQRLVGAIEVEELGSGTRQISALVADETTHTGVAPAASAS